LAWLSFTARLERQRRVARDPSNAVFIALSFGIGSQTTVRRSIATASWEEGMALFRSTVALVLAFGVTSATSALAQKKYDTGATALRVSVWGGLTLYTQDAPQGLPATYQGTVIRDKGDPFLNIRPPAGMSLQQQRRLLDNARWFDERHMAGREDDSNQVPHPKASWIHPKKSL